MKLQRGMKIDIRNDIGLHDDQRLAFEVRTHLPERSNKSEWRPFEIVGQRCAPTRTVIKKRFHLVGEMIATDADVFHAVTN